MDRLYRARLIVSLLAALLVFAAINSPVYAAINAYVIVGRDNRHYEIEFEALLDSYVRYALGSADPLFNFFRDNTARIFAIRGNLGNYVDFEDILDAYVKAVLRNQAFDVNQYISGATARRAQMPAEFIAVSPGSGGALTFTPRALSVTGDLLAAVNRAATAAELETLVRANAAGLGLDLNSFNRLNLHGRGAVLAEVLARRPAAGFASLANFKDRFDQAVAAAAAALQNAIRAVNDAGNVAAMNSALNGGSEIMELALGRYNLAPSERDRLAARLIELRPFASSTELRWILHTVVVGLRSASTINFTRYNFTLPQMLDIQMAATSPPQTDRSGGGWRNATRDETAFFINPLNFIDMSHDGSLSRSIRIDVSTLRVRERPTTQSPQLTDALGGLISVSRHEVFAILGQSEAEPGTAPGTEGTWYRISVSNREGWVSGRVDHVTVLERVFAATPMFQFLTLSGSAGATAADLDRLLAGRGILNGMGAVFLEAARANNINEIFLVSLALHESGNGTSRLATGIEVEDRDKLYPGVEANYARAARVNTDSLRVRERPTTESPQIKDNAGNDINVRLNEVYPILEERAAEMPTLSGTEGPWYRISVSGKEGWISGAFVEVIVSVRVFNLFGIGAFDANPNHHGSQFAYTQRWFSPEAAVRGGAHFASVRYVNNPNFLQNTLYKMRWNPARPGSHQYATDIGWAAKQVPRIRSLYNLLDNYTLTFDIPRFRE